jgi:hypothetical protein
VCHRNDNFKASISCRICLKATELQFHIKVLTLGA